MKTFFKVVLFVLVAAFYSCSEDLHESVEPTTSQNEGSVRRKSPGDNIYDALGYGYDATGLYMNSYSTTFPVISIEKFKAAEPQNIDIDLSTSTEGYLSSGANSEDYANSLTASLAVECKWPLFSAQVKTTYSLNNSNSSKYSYGSYNMILRQKRISINSSTPNLANYLSDQFIKDLDTQSADYIVRNYGTHVLLEVELGAKLELSYQTISSSASKKEAVNAGLVMNIGKIFSVNADVATNSSLATTNTSETIRYKTFGGNVNKSLVGTIALSNTSPTVDISGWQSTCDKSNMVLINVAPKKMIYIYDLITDPAKKAAVKVAVENYISANTIMDVVKLDAQYVGSAYIIYMIKLDDLANRTICNLFPNDKLRAGTVSLYKSGYNYSFLTTVITLSTDFNTKSGYRNTLLGNVYKSAVDNSVIPLYEFQVLTSSKAYTYRYSTDKLKYGNGDYDSVGQDGCSLKRIVCYVPR